MSVICRYLFIDDCVVARGLLQRELFEQGFLYAPTQTTDYPSYSDCLLKDSCDAATGNNHPGS